MPSQLDNIRSAQIVGLLRVFPPEGRVGVFERIAEAFCTKCGKTVEESCGCTEDEGDE